jgi:hypothetical protein
MVIKEKRSFLDMVNIVNIFQKTLTKRERILKKLEKESPKHWHREDKISEKIDEFFIESLKDPVITEIGDCTCLLNGVMVWTANRYYAGPCLYSHEKDVPKGYTHLDTANEFYDLLDKIDVNSKKNKDDKWFEDNKPQS